MKQIALFLSRHLLKIHLFCSRSANTYLETIDEIIDNMNLTSIVAFHSQQSMAVQVQTLLNEQ
ncbi:hypothetical protein SAMN05660420_02709 [Desulfuromusa kysingii]|uniref:Uncharacterized protein n=1 Tax=Desulfuromusa kysingii TaxID=37625 RepID=A0A1H4CWT5_9BACT|nr:hypothetical protein [Desulfuromusa kysingii]SEA64915.1 hypothetical protein SAMN05660420_02709 [Desulfuromusa kysingii]